MAMMVRSMLVKSENCCVNWALHLQLNSLQPGSIKPTCLQGMLFMNLPAAAANCPTLLQCRLEQEQGQPHSERVCNI